jgi:hypothetical protein
VLSSDPAGRGPNLLVSGHLKFPALSPAPMVFLHVSLVHQFCVGYFLCPPPRLRLLLYFERGILLRCRLPPWNIAARDLLPR